MNISTSLRFFSVPLALLVSTLLLSLQARDSEEIISFDATWWYNDSDTDLGTEWVKPDYDHSSWSQGQALLGYDTTSTRHNRWPEPGLQTNLRENLTTYYFRKDFDYDGPLEGILLEIEQIIDDGAVYYLNGIEIGRSDLMPEGTITHSTRTTSYTNPDSDQELIVVVNPPLVEGRNVLAVSVHNVGPGSSDICFGARFTLSEATAIPRALYLTWQQDPTTTMTVHWHSEDEEKETYLLFYPKDDADPVHVPAETNPMPFSSRLVHTVELTDLTPDVEYSFQLANLSTGLPSPVYQFRTMPKTADRPIRIVLGGDQLHRKEWMLKTNQQATLLDPDFIVWGGDLAYADGLAERVDRWYQFFDANVEGLITADNRVIPVLFGIGNHEVVGGYWWREHENGRDFYPDTDEYRERIAPYYYNLFAWPGHPGYGVLDFGDYMSIIMLDSDHSGPIEGKQTEWLREQLKSRQEVPHVLPVYHVPGFPSFRNYDGATSRRVREHWIPLFEEFGIEVAFENHDHTYKRTFPIMGETISDKGIIYIGDGAWGVGVREPDLNRWYMKKGERLRHLILLSMHGKYRDFKVIDSDGNLIDHFFDYSGQRAEQR